MDRIQMMEMVRSFQCGQLSRREFLKRATLVVGATAAAQLLAACGASPAGDNPSPVVDEEATRAAATTPTTGAAESESNDLMTENVTYPDGEGGELMGYLARPAAEGQYSAVIVIQEWWGLNEHIRDVTRRFASEGFVALAPDLYDGVVTTEPDEARKLVMELDMVQAVQEIGQAIDYVLDQQYTTGNEAGIVGFCMGGRLVLQTVRVYDTVGAAVAFYGTPLEPPQASEVQAPVLGLYGSEDSSIDVENVRAMEDALQEAGIEHEIEIYQGAEHAFFNDTRDSYNQAAAEDAWPRTLEWFRQRL